MKTIAISSFLVLFAIISGLTMIPDVYADHAKVTIEVAEDWADQNCVEKQSCFSPQVATVDVGGEVTFSNNDAAPHTMTAGNKEIGKTGEFDTELLQPDDSYSWVATEAGEIQYWCLLHSWMEGTIIVQEAGAEEDGHMDGELTVEISTPDSVKAGERLPIDLVFNEQHVNFKVIVSQSGNVILEEEAHAHLDGSATVTTPPLENDVSEDNPINIKVESLGIGLPGEQANWTGPTGEVASVNVVPEFGTIAALILAVAIISIVAVSAKSKLSIIPRY